MMLLYIDALGFQQVRLNFYNPRFFNDGPSLAQPIIIFHDAQLTQTCLLRIVSTHTIYQPLMNESCIIQSIFATLHSTMFALNNFVLSSCLPWAQPIISPHFETLFESQVSTISIFDKHDYIIPSTFSLLWFFDKHMSVPWKFSSLFYGRNKSSLSLSIQKFEPVECSRM